MYILLLIKKYNEQEVKWWISNVYNMEMLENY